MRNFNGHRNQTESITKYYYHHINTSYLVKMNDFFSFCCHFYWNKKNKINTNLVYTCDFKMFSTFSFFRIYPKQKYLLFSPSAGVSCIYFTILTSYQLNFNFHYFNFHHLSFFNEKEAYLKLFRSISMTFGCLAWYNYSDFKII